jgi:hypothetical protein
MSAGGLKPGPPVYFCEKALASAVETGWLFFERQLRD